MTFTNKVSEGILFLYPCYQYFFFERLYNFKELNKFFEEIVDIADRKIFIKFHPRHFNSNDPIFGLVKENAIGYSIEDDLLEHIHDFDTIVGFEPSGALVESIILRKKVVYINDYINRYENEKSLEKFISMVNSLSFSEFLLKTKCPNLNLKVLGGNQLNYFRQNKRINYEEILEKILAK